MNWRSSSWRLPDVLLTLLLLYSPCCSLLRSIRLYLQVLEADVSVDLLVDVAVLDRDAPLVHLDVEVDDDRLLDVLVDLLTLDVLLLHWVCEV